MKSLLDAIITLYVMIGMGIGLSWPLWFGVMIWN